MASPSEGRMRRESENLLTQASEDLETAGVLLEGRRFYAGGLLAMPVSGVELFCYTPEEFERGREAMMPEPYGASTRCWR